MPYGLKDIELEKMCGVFASNERIERVVLYGSRAKGNYKPFPDVDITLMGEKLTHSDLNRISLAVDDLLLPYQFDISIFHTLKNEALIYHIHRIGITIYERESEWKEYKLGEICTELSDGLHKAPIFCEGGDYIFVNAKNISNGYIVDNDAERKSTYEEYLKYSSPLNDTTILYSIDGTIGNIALYRGEKCILGKGACYINPNPSIIDRLYLYYELQSPRFKAYIDRMSTGSTIQHISLKTMRNYTFTSPTLVEQRRIASILTSLDDKIDLLHRENATLEAMAETLFRQWFVEEAKEDWEEGLVSDIAEHTKNSINPQKYPDTIFQHYSIPAYDVGKEPTIETGESIQSNKYLVPKNCILFSKLNPHKDKRVWLMLDDVPDNAICSTEFQVVKPSNVEFLYFMYGWLTHKENYEEIASGVGGTSGSHQRIDPKSIFSFTCPKVDLKTIQNYNKVVAPLFNKQRNNQQQIQTLIQTRDGLLPRLMSGELKV